MKLLHRITIFAIFLLAIFPSTRVAAQEQPVVYAVFFFSPTCPHCHEVMTNSLPPIQAKYGSQLVVFPIDTTQKSGQEIYTAAVSRFNIPDNRRGVPTLILGETVLVGSFEIPEQLPGLIDAGLAQGGVAWPDIPGLSDYFAQVAAQATPTAKPTSSVFLPATSASSAEKPVESQDEPNFVDQAIEKFKRDPVANTIAVVLLLVLLASFVASLILLTGAALAENPPAYASNRLSRLIPILALVGLGIAIYMTFIETTGKKAICGPVGDCNTVQQSKYAKLFGVLPVGVFGLFGYFCLLIAWAVYSFGPKSLRTLSSITLWGMAIFGVAFSIYLTFLEPFVIGASCVWCLSSATVMVLTLWATTPLACHSLHFNEE